MKEYKKYSPTSESKGTFRVCNASLLPMLHPQSMRFAKTKNETGCLKIIYAGFGNFQNLHKLFPTITNEYCKIIMK
jgi:hypothetical protein